MSNDTIASDGVECFKKANSFFTYVCLDEYNLFAIIRDVKNWPCPSIFLLVNGYSLDQSENAEILTSQI